MSLRKLIYSDYRRYMTLGKWSPLRVILASQGIWASFVYRISHYMYVRTKDTIFSQSVRLGCGLAKKCIELLTGISIKYESEIGEGLGISHFGNVFVGCASMGRNCSISQGVTIGAGEWGAEAGTPQIGDRVYIGPNAVVLGRITIGNDVAIGAGAVVTRSIPDRAVVIGNPAKIVWYEGSFNLVRYDGMEEDPERCASLSRRGPSVGSKEKMEQNDQ